MTTLSCRCRTSTSSELHQTHHYMVRCRESFHFMLCVTFFLRFSSISATLLRVHKSVAQIQVPVYLLLFDGGEGSGLSHKANCNASKHLCNILSSLATLQVNEQHVFVIHKMSQPLILTVICSLSSGEHPVMTLEPAEQAKYWVATRCCVRMYCSNLSCLVFTHTVAMFNHRAGTLTLSPVEDEGRPYYQINCRVQCSGLLHECIRTTSWDIAALSMPNFLLKN